MIKNFTKKTILLSGLALLGQSEAFARTEPLRLFSFQEFEFPGVNIGSGSHTNDAWNPVITPYVKGAGDWEKKYDVEVENGWDVYIGPQADCDGSWSWTGPDNFKSNNREIQIWGAQDKNAGQYVLTFTSTQGGHATATFNVKVITIPAITPYVTDDGSHWEQQSSIATERGKTIQIGPQANVDGSWYWTGPNGFTSQDREIKISNVSDNTAGAYQLTFTAKDGTKLQKTFYITFDAAAAPFVAVNKNETYRLKANDGKSLYVLDSSFETSAEVQEWEETNVSAQQWYKVDAGNNTFKFVNVYSGMFLIYDGGARQSSNSNNPKAVWTIQGDKAINGQASYTLEKVKAQDEFTAELRDRVMSGFLGQFLQTKNEGLNFMTITNGGWGESESLEVLLDAYETSKNPQYLNIFKQCYAYFKDNVGDRWDGGTRKGDYGYGWFGDDYNDDVMWHIILAARAFKLTGDKMYLEDSRRNFDIIWNRAYLGYIGMLRWAEKQGDKNGTNSCINGPAEVAACYIAEGYASLNDLNTANTYWDKAKELYGNHRIYLANINTGQVYDNVKFEQGTHNVKETGTWASTYNQGTMLGAATMLYRHFGDNFYKEDAQKIYGYTAREMTNANRIVKQCEGLKNGDLQGFKGILMRYIRNYYEQFGDEDARDMLLRNAFHVYNNRNSKGFGLTNWRIKAPEDYKYDTKDYSKTPFSAITVVSAAYNAPILLTTGNATTIEVENMNLSGGAQAVTDARASNGGYANGIGNSGRASFTYDAPADGKYFIDIYYMSAQKRDIQVTANSQTVTTTCRSNGSWDGEAVSKVRVSVNLKAGQNTIVLGSNNGYAPNLDKVEVWATTNGNVVSIQRDGGVMEAEEAEINGGVHIDFEQGASNNGAVSYIGQGRTLVFHYNADVAGEYNVDIHYYTAVDRSMYTQVNNGEKKVENYSSTGSWKGAESQVKSVKVQLNAGENTITVGNDNGDAPNLDCIVVTPSSSLGIQEVSNAAASEQGNGRIFNLNGQEVKTVKKGDIYITNGRKFIAK